MKKAVGCGILSCFFFSFVFLLNRSMNLAGGYWMWTASLRYLFTLPIITVLLLVMPGHKMKPVICEIRKDPMSWLVWSTVGFGLFYLPLTLASLVGAFSGIVATVLFFHATDMVKNDTRKLAAVEATECSEVLFTLTGGIFILGDRPPDPVGFAGIALIVGGMIADNLLSG